MEKTALNNRPQDGRRILTIKETATAYNFPEYTLRRLVKDGAFPVIQAGKRAYIVRERFEEYLGTGGKAYVSSY